MKILLASSSSGSRGGGELYLVYLGRALAQRGHEVTLWASSHSRMDELANTFSSFGEVLRSKYTNTYDLRGRSLSASLNLAAMWRVAREWRKARVDLVHLNKQNLEDGLDLLHAARRSGVPSLCTIHLTQSARYLQAKYHRMRDWAARRALRKYPGLLVTVLESRRKDLLQFMEATPKVRLVANGVPLWDLTQRDALRNSLRRELNLTPQDLLFLEVGRLVPQKRPLLFIEKAEQILRTFPQSHFLWIGDGSQNAEWDAEVARRNLGDRVRRLPWQMDVRPYLFAADVFLHVADFEGLPLAILEAMSAELPCALTPNLLEEMSFFNAANSLIVEDPRAWQGVVDAPARLRALGQAGRRLAEAEFSFQRMAEQYETLYQVSIRREA